MSSLDQFRYTEESKDPINAPHNLQRKRKRNPAKSLPSRSPKTLRQSERDIRSFAPFVAEGVHSLILGTAPSEKSLGIGLTKEDIRLRGGSGQQNYGHPRNCFFNIVGSCFGFERHATPYARQVETLLENGYGIWDVLCRCRRAGSLDSAIAKGSSVPNNIPKLLRDFPSIRRLVFPNNSAVIFRKQFLDWLQSENSIQFFVDKESPTMDRSVAVFKPGVKAGVALSTWRDLDSSKRRRVELCVLPSTSPAFATMRPPEKEKLWHSACFKLRKPPDMYSCIACRESNHSEEEPHWLHDCSKLSEWRDSHRAERSSGKVLATWYY